MNEKEMTFLEHLEDLRKAILKSCLAVLAGSILCLLFSEKIFRFLKAPLQEMLPPGSHFIAVSPFESYAAYFKIALVFGILLSSPFLFFVIWSFIRPGLTRQERQGVIPAAMLCSLLFVGGALFGYFIVFPAGFRFAVDILKGTDILFLPRMSDYLSFSLRMLIAFGIIFELPLFLLLLGKFGVVDAARLRKWRKYVIVLIFLVAGILTPSPDLLSQVLMALPLLLLYEIGILMVRISQRKKPAPNP